jgi:hypothetical protein
MHNARVSIPLTIQQMAEIAHEDDVAYASFLAETEEVTEAKWADEIAIIMYAQAHAIAFGASFDHAITRFAATTIAMVAVDTLCTRGVLPADTTVADAAAVVSRFPELKALRARHAPAVIETLRSLWGYFDWRRETPHLEAILAYLARPETAHALRAALQANPPPRRGQRRRRTRGGQSAPTRTTVRAPKTTKNQRKRARKARRAGRK